MILARQNLHFLNQASALLEALDDAHFTSRDAHGHSSAGAHLRHVLDAYRCFLRGLEDGRVDYDARQRDLRVETERQVASERLDGVRQGLAAVDETQRHQELEVRSDAAAWGELDAWTHSTVGRELQFLLSHTVHHFALVAMTLRSLGFDPGADFGVAPSTLEYLNSQETQDAEEASEVPACAQ